MGYASIEGENSHCQNKKFKQRLKYRIDQGYSPEQAYELASVKLRLLCQPQSSQAADENYPQKIDQKLSDFRQYEKPESSDENSSDEQNTRPAPFSCDPTEDEIRREVVQLKAKGRMTEIPIETNSANQTVASLSVSSSNSSLVQSDSHGPLEGISILACAWLVMSMTFALPGAWYWTLPIAIAIEFTPMLVFGAKLPGQNRLWIDAGAIGIFLIGLLLYVAPSIQTLWNEGTEYSSAMKTYLHETSDFSVKSKNAQDLIDRSKTRSDLSETNFNDVGKAFGSNSWRTVVAKKQYDHDFQDWKDRSKEQDVLKAPVVPKIKDDLTTAAQTIATRIVLFAVVFLLMYVKRKL